MMRKIKRHALPWQRWYAWYPVETDNEWVWCEWVWRKYVVGTWDDGYIYRTEQEHDAKQQKV